MPTNDFYKNNYFPTIFDYTNNMSEAGLAVVDEIKTESNFLKHAALVPTNDGMRHRYVRKNECQFTPRVAALDAHYKPSIVNPTKKEKSFECMYANGRMQWEKKQPIQTPLANAADTKAEGFKTALDGMLKLKQSKMIYSKSAEDTSTVDIKALSMPGLFSYLDNCYDSAAINKLYTRLDDYKNPFDNVDEKLVSISNYSATRTGKGAEYVTTGADFTSILGVAFGSEGVLTTFPSTVQGNAGAGYSMEFGTEKNARDDNGEYYAYDYVNFDMYFGIGVLNRYCLMGLRNIFLGHTNSTALFDEMAAVERNLITLKDFYDRGETGYTMAFYCSPRLITAMEQYQKANKVNYYAVDSREFNGMSPLKRPKFLPITSDIVLYSDVCFKTSEKYVSGTVAASTI